MFECPNCAYNIKFDIATQQMKCEACESLFDPYAIQREIDAESSEYYETNVFTCPQCGGQIISDDTEAATFCLFCGSSTMLTERISKEKRPAYIIPFQKTKEDCKKAYKRKMRKAFFVPKEYKNREFIDGFKGVYMPYWSYCFSKEGEVSLTGKTSKRDGDYLNCEKYKLTGNVSMEFNGDSYDAATSLYDDLSAGLAPYEFEGRRQFTPSFMSGFYADCADVSQDLYFKDAKEYARKHTVKQIKKVDAFKKYDLPLSENFPFEVDTRADRTLYPVWFMSYRIKDRISYAMVNGQTGKVVADLPMDKKKFIFSSFLLAIPIFVLLNMLIIFNTKELLGLSLFMLFMSLLVYASELSALFEKENLWNDRAFLNSNNKWKSQKRRQKKENEKLPGSVFLGLFGIRFDNGWKVSPFLVIMLVIGLIIAIPLETTLWPMTAFFAYYGIRSVRGQLMRMKKSKTPFAVILSIMAIVAVIAVFLIKPVHDLWYYGVTILTLASVAVNFIYIIKDYNRLAMRKLPQFNKKGGDDRA